MNLTLSTPAAIAVVIVLGLIISSLFIVIISVAAQKLPGGRFDEHEAERRAGEDSPAYVEHVDQALAAVADDEPTQVLAPVVQLVHDEVLGAPVLRINGAGRRGGITEVAP